LKIHDSNVSILVLTVYYVAMDDQVYSLVVSIKMICLSLVYAFFLIRSVLWLTCFTGIIFLSFFVLHCFIAV